MNVIRLRKSPPLLLPPPGPCESRLGFLNSGKVYFLSLEKRDCFYGKGLCGKGEGTGGTGSSPPRLKGWQRSSLQVANATPRNGPWVAIATAAYSEQVGKKRQPPGLSVCNAGESQRR